MPHTRSFLLLDDTAESSEGFIAYAEARGLMAYAARTPAQFAQLAGRLMPALVALDFDMQSLDPIEALETLARLGTSPEIILFGREPRLLAIGVEAARLLRLETPQKLLAPIDFRGLTRTARLGAGRVAEYHTRPSATMAAKIMAA